MVSNLSEAMSEVDTKEKKSPIMNRMAPIHHHFEKKGWPESTVVIRFWIISIILAMIGLATLKLR